MGVVSLLSMAVGAYGVSVKNEKRLTELEEKAHRLISIEKAQDEENSMIRNDLIGLTTMNEKRFNFTGNSLSGFLHVQRINRAHLMETWSLLKNLSHSDAASNTVLLHLQEQNEMVQKVTGILDSVRRRIRDFEVGMVSLLNNQLSTYFMSYSKLRNVLFKIKENLPDEYQLGISTSDIHLYYYHRLTSFVRVEDKLVIRLIVPLSVNRGYVVPDVLYQPLYNAFPVPKEFDKRGSQDFLKLFVRSNNMWLFSGNQFVSQISTKHLSCHDIGPYKDCIRFLPAPELPPPKCVSMIWQSEFDPEKLFSPTDTPCQTYAVDRDTYNPIRLSDQTYMIHGSSFLSYRVECPNNKIVTLDVGEDISMTSVDLEEGCALRMNRRLYPGPIVSRYFNYTMAFMQPAPALTLPNNITRMRLYSVTPIPLRPINASNIKYEPVNLSAPVDKIISRLRREAEAIESRVEKASVTLATSFAPHQSLGMLKSIQKFMFEMFVLLFALISLRKANWIKRTAPTVIVLADSASASVF